MNIEEAFHIVGNCGKFQLCLLISFFVTNLILSMQMVLMVIVGATPNVTHEDQQNLTTIVTDFNLYDKPWVVDLMQSLYMGGFMAGCFLLGQLSDLFGRRKVLIASVILASLTNLSSGLTYSWQTFAVSRLFGGFFMGGVGMSAFVLMNELVGQKTWTWAGIVYSTFFSIGIMSFAGLSYLLQHWRYICFVTSSLYLLIFPLHLIFLPESPRWLYSTGKIQQAEAVMRKMAERNGNNSAGIVLTSSSSTNTADKQHTIIDFFRHFKLALWILAMCFIWFTSALVYYGFTMSANDLTSDLFVGVALSGAVEIPAMFLCIPLMRSKWFGRKGTTLLTFVVCMAACVGLTFTPESRADVHLALGLSGKLSIAATFAVIYIYTAEIFPTPLRNVAVGVSSTVARVGSVTVPFISLASPKMSYVVFAATCGVAGVCVLVLPRTLGFPIPQSIEEAVDRSRIPHPKSRDDTNHNSEPTSNDKDPLISVT